MAGALQHRLEGTGLSVRYVVWEPEWQEPFSIDATEQASQPVMLQVNDLLGRLIPRGPEAVAEMGHYFTGSDQLMISTAAAAAIVGGQ